MDSLEEVKRIFLTDVDEETLIENQERIIAWEKGLIESEEYISWQEHPVTQKILKEATKTYIDSVITLGKNRNLTPEVAERLRGAQDASGWLIELMAKDKKSELSRINDEIRTAINATKP